MSQSLEVVFNMKFGNVIRNSDDYFDRKGYDNAVHVLNNAMNNILFHPVSFCDWDMFMTYQNEAEFHAAARAISGGPLYFADEVGKTNFDLVQKLSALNLNPDEVRDVGLFFEQPAIPCSSSVFIDMKKVSRALKTCNFVGNVEIPAKKPFYAVVACFNVSKDKKPIRDFFTVNEIIHTICSGNRRSPSACMSGLTALFAQNGCALFSSHDESCHFIPASEFSKAQTVFLPRMCSFNFSTICNVKMIQTEKKLVAFAPFGIANKFNSAVAVKSWDVHGNETSTVYTCFGKQYVFFSSEKPNRCLIKLSTHSCEHSEWRDFTTRTHFVKEKNLLVLNNSFCGSLPIEKIVFSFG